MKKLANTFNENPRVNNKIILGYIFDNLNCENSDNQITGNITWNEIEKKTGKLSDDDKINLINFLNKNSKEEIINLVKDCSELYIPETIKFVFSDTFNVSLFLNVEFENTNLDNVDSIEVDDGDYQDKKYTKEHDDRKYW